MTLSEESPPVKTAIQFQVRQPLQQGAVGKWRPYAAYLEPVARILDLDLDGNPA